MGTFHQNKHELHGITVVVDTSGPKVFIGRCDDIDDASVFLVDVDEHTDGEGGTSKEAYVRNAARWGVWKRHARLTVPRASVTSIRPLGTFADDA